MVTFRPRVDPVERGRGVTIRFQDRSIPSSGRRRPELVDVESTRSVVLSNVENERPELLNGGLGERNAGRVDVVSEFRHVHRNRAAARSFETAAGMPLFELVAELARCADASHEKTTVLRRASVRLRVRAVLVWVPRVAVGHDLVAFDDVVHRRDAVASEVAEEDLNSPAKSMDLLEVTDRRVTRLVDLGVEFGIRFERGVALRFVDVRARDHSAGAEERRIVRFVPHRETARSEAVEVRNDRRHELTPGLEARARTGGRTARVAPLRGNTRQNELRLETVGNNLLNEVSVVSEIRLSCSAKARRGLVDVDHHANVSDAQLMSALKEDTNAVRIAAEHRRVVLSAEFHAAHRERNQNCAKCESRYNEGGHQ